MTATIFARSIKQTVFPSEARASSLATLIERGEPLLDGENIKCVHVVDGGHVLEGEEHAALIADDGSIILATLAEARDYEDDEEDEEDDDSGEEDDDADFGDDEEDDDEEDDDSDDDDEEEDESTNEATTSRERYAALSRAIAGTSLPRKLKEQAAEALAARFEELPGAFDRARFVRAAITTDAGEEVEEGLQRSADLMAWKGDSGYTLAIRSKRGGWDIHGTDNDRLTSNPSKTLVGINPPKEWGQRVPLGQLPKALQGDIKTRLKANFGPSAQQAESLDEAAMTKRHFAMIAQALAELDFPMNYKRELVGAVTDAIAGMNDRFDRERFIKATGLTPSQVSEHQHALAASVGMEEQMFITYCEDGVQLVNESGAQVALVRCDTQSAVESARAINAIEEYAASVGYELAADDVAMDEDTTDESAIIEAEWEAVDDMRASLALAIESFDADEHVRYGPIVRQIDEAINEGDFELAEELAEPLLEYKRMGQAARRARIRSIRTGIPKAVRSGKLNRAEHRRQLLQRRRTYRTSAGMRSKAKRYAKRYGRFRARLRPVGGRANESVREILRPLDDILRDSAEAERRMGIAPGSLTAILTQEHADLARKINEAAMSARINEAHKRIVKRALAVVPRATGGAGIPEAEVRVRTEGSNVVVEHDYGDGHVFSETVPVVDEARQTKEEKQRSAEITATYGKWFDRVPVPILKLPAIKRDIEALLASKADLNVEMPKLVTKYKAESVEEAGDKLGVLAGEVMTYLINRPRATAEDLQRKFRCTANAAGKIMNVAAQALAQGDAKGTYPGHVKAIGDILAADGAFESEGEQRLPFIREAGGESTFGQLAKGAKFRMPDDVANAVLQKLTPTSYKVLTADDEFARGLTIKSVKASEPVIPIEESDVAKGHRTKIALSTLKMHAIGARVMGGMSHAQAVRFLTTEAGYSKQKVRDLLFKAGHNESDIDDMFHAADKADEGSEEDLSAIASICQTIYTKAYDAFELRVSGKIPAAQRLEREVDALQSRLKRHGNFAVDAGEQVEQEAQADARHGSRRDFGDLWSDVRAELSDDGDYGESVDERVHCAIVLNEAVQLPTNTTIKIPDVRQENRGLPRDQVPMIEVPAFKLAKATVFMPNEMFGNWNRHEVNDLVMWLGRYAQYESALHVQFRVKRKRNASSRVLSYRPRIVVYEGWGIDLEPESMFGEPERDDKLGIEIKRGRRMGFDAGWDSEMQQRVAAYSKKPKLAIFESVAGQRVHEVEDGETMFQRGDGEPVSAADVIRVGDRVTIHTPHGGKRTGKAVMRGPAGWVLNLGGAHGTPGIATDRNVSTIKRGGKVVYTDESLDEAVPGIAKWQTFAGGTGAAEGKYSYQWNTPHGEYHLSPFTRNGGRHAGYMLKFANTAKGEGGKHLGKGLWIDLGVHRSPNDGAKAAREHDASIGTSESNDPEYDALVESGFKARGEFDDRAAAEVRADMPKPGMVSKQYVFTSKKAGRTFKRGETVTYKGEKWRVYDADADGSDMTLYLVSPDFKRWLRDVPPTLDEAFDEAKETFEVGPYSEYSVAQEKAMKLQARGARGLKIDKKKDKWWIHYTADAKLHEASDDASLDGVRVRAKGVFAKGLEDGVTYTLKKGEPFSGEDTYVFMTKRGKRAARFPVRDIRRYLHNGARGDHNGLVRESADEAANLEVGDNAHVPSINKTGLVVAVEGSTVTLQFPNGSTKRFSKSKVERVAGDDEFYEAKRTPHVGDRVRVKGGKEGVIVSQRMAPPRYSEPEAFSVKLDDVKRPGYVGSMYSADDVELIDEAHDPLDDIPARPDMSKYAAREREMEDALVNAIFNGTKLGDGFKRYVNRARAMLGAHGYKGFKCKAEALQDAFRTGGEIDCTFQGSKAEARGVARAMLNVMDAHEEGLDEGAIETGVDDVPEIGFKSGNYYLQTKSGAKHFPPERGTRKQRREAFRQKLRNEFNVSNANALIAKLDAAIDASESLDEGRITVKVTADNGDHWVTGINATFEEAKRYFIGKRFNLGSGGTDKMVKAVKVELVGDESVDEADAKKRVYIVHWSDPSNPGGGPAGDGSFINRFKKQADAERFARGRPGPYGSGAATVDAADVPLRLWKRWNSEGLIEGLDEKTVECSYCGKRKPKHSGSDEEPYCAECDKKMEKLRDAQSARYEKARKQDFEEAKSEPRVGDRVAYKASFLRNTGMHTGTAPRARGTITAFEKLATIQLAVVDWGKDKDELPARVNVGNLSVVTAARGVPDESIDEGVELPDGRVFDIKTGRIVESTDEAVRKKLDFRDYEALVRTWHDKQLTGALADIQKTLPAADKLDRDSGSGDEGGYYRDQASVIHREIERRRKGGKREESTDEAARASELPKELKPYAKFFPEGLGRLQYRDTPDGKKQGYYLRWESYGKVYRSAGASHGSTGSYTGTFTVDEILARVKNVEKRGDEREIAYPAGANESEEVVYTEQEYDALDEATRKKLKGYWRTTERGQRIFIEKGRITKGNPHLMRAVGGR